MTTSRRGGPHRSESARQAILDAATELMLTDGYPALTIERIAARAGAGKQTIYRWWRSKSAILAECVLTGRLAPAGPELSDTGDPVADVATWLVAACADDAATAIVRGLAAAAAEDADLRRALYSEVTRPAHHRLSARLARAHAREATAQDSLVAEALLGIVLYRQLTDADGPLPSRDELAVLLDLPAHTETR